MAKAQVAARFVTEVAPPRAASSIMRRRKVPRILDTIAEDEREQLAYGPSSSDQGVAAAWSRRAAPPPAQARAGSCMRELSKYFSDAHGGQQAGGWEGGHKLGHGHRRAVVHESQKNAA